MYINHHNYTYLLYIILASGGLAAVLYLYAVNRTRKKIKKLIAKTEALHAKRHQQEVDDYKLKMYEPYKGKKK